jgi:hypothetical protein
MRRDGLYCAIVVALIIARLTAASDHLAAAGDYAEPVIRSMGWKGRYLVVGFAAGEIPKIPLTLVLLKCSSLVGMFWGSFAAQETKKNQQNLMELVGNDDAGQVDAADLGHLSAGAGRRRPERRHGAPGDRQGRSRYRQVGRSSADIRMAGEPAPSNDFQVRQAGCDAPDSDKAPCICIPRRP